MSLSSSWSPVINGCHQGSLVEIFGIDRDIDDSVNRDLNGQQGQLTEYEDDKFGVHLLSTGKYVQLDPAFVRPCANLQKPGHGGDENSFDIIVGPRTKRTILGEEIGACLAEKGFCVVKTIQDAADLKTVFADFKEAESSGLFGRLPQELEEGYLGKSGRAKVMWLNPLDPSAAEIPHTVWTNDYKLTTIAECVQPLCEDILGSQVTDRTPALVCLTMTDSEEEKYMRPAVDDQSLLDYYNTWSRSLLRMVLFLGPEAGLVTLEPKWEAPLTELQSEYRISASSGTVVIVREDTHNFMYDEPDEGESSWMECFLLNPEPTWTLDQFEDASLMDIFGKTLDGPPPPTEEVVNVISVGIQAASNMMDKVKEWAAYTAGTDGQLLMPFSRFDIMPYFTEDVDNPNGLSYVKHFSVMDGVDLFDNKVFEISNSEAQALDPQNRQVLEVGLTCLHFGLGLTKKKANQSASHASISVGCDKNEWTDMQGAGVAPSSVATNNQLAIAANRFSYVFNMKGGSYVCDTACSASLIAMHLGKCALLERRWDPLEFHLGIGVNLTLTPFSFCGSSSSHMLSQHGRCFTFNATATGYNRGDGTGGLLLQTGEKEDKMCFLRGSQIGNDGRSASMSAPNGPAQEKCIWGAVREARMNPPESTVWECHGTGTSLGDPIEVGAVRKVQIKMPRVEPLMIATSKSNIGHLEGGSAAIAMVKCCVVVGKTLAAPTLHLAVLNPHLDHTQFDAFYNTELSLSKYTRMHCQVSSFGVGGTNGHAIFWGENKNLGPQEIDAKKLLMAKLSRQKPTLIADGLNPADWDFSGPDFKSKPGDRYIISIEKDPITGETPIRWIKADPVDDAPEFYSITGNYNNWDKDAMEKGDVADVHFAEVRIPTSGILKFRFLLDGDKSKALGPTEDDCTWRTMPMDDVRSDCETSWMVEGVPHETIRIELLAPPNAPRTVNWFKVR